MERKSNKVVVVIVAVIIVAVLGVAAYAVASNQSRENTESQTKPTDTSAEKSTEDTQSAATDGEQADAQTTIVFTDQGFSPAEYISKAGEAVKVENKSSTQLQFSSDAHPTHTDEPELNLTVLEPGESATFTPTKAGTWGFHDHLHDQYTGTLEVTE